MKLKQTLRSEQNAMNKKIFQMIKLVGMHNFFLKTCQIVNLVHKII